MQFLLNNRSVKVVFFWI